MFQRPSATYAAGFNTWKSLGRHVKKGEKGITVLAPIVVSRKKEQAEVEDQREEQQAVAGFRPVTVFDISQTGGQPLPEVTKVAGDPKSTDRLKDYVERLGIELEYSSEIQPAKGVSCGGKIILLPDLNPAEAFATLVHETAHEAFHKADRRLKRIAASAKPRLKPLPSSSQAIGLDCLSASADYIQLWNGDRATLVESFQFIQKTAIQILSAILPANSQGLSGMRFSALLFCSRDPTPPLRPTPHVTVFPVGLPIIITVEFHQCRIDFSEATNLNQREVSEPCQI
jgi:hypothetical protein